MAKDNVNINCELTYYLLPWVCYRRVGDVALFSVFGIHLYQRVGDAKGLFGVINWGGNA